MTGYFDYIRWMKILSMYDIMFDSDEWALFALYLWSQWLIVAVIYYGVFYTNLPRPANQINRFQISGLHLKSSVSWNTLSYIYYSQGTV